MIREQLEMDVQLVPGKRGQFEVVVDGQTIVTRGGNLFTRMLGAGYPDFDEVVRTLAGKKDG